MPQDKLTKEQLDKLTAELTTYAEEGATDDELREFRTAYIKEIGSVEGESVNFTNGSSEPQEQSTTTTSATESEQPKKDGETPSEFQQAMQLTPEVAAQKEAKTPEEIQIDKDVSDIFDGPHRDLPPTQKVQREDMTLIEKLSQTDDPYDKAVIQSQISAAAEIDEVVNTKIAPLQQEMFNTLSEQYRPIIEEKAADIRSRFESGEISEEQANEEIGAYTQKATNMISTRVANSFEIRKAYAKETKPIIEKVERDIHALNKMQYESSKLKSKIKAEEAQDAQDALGAWENLGNFIGNEQIKTKMLPAQLTQLASQVTEEFQDPNKKGTVYSMAADGELTAQQMTPAELQAENLRVVDGMREEMAPTKELLRSLKEGDWGGAATTAVGSTISFAGSMVRAFATGGLSMAGEVMEPMWAEAVIAKSEELGISVEEVLAMDAEDEITSISLGFAAAALERIGVKSAGKMLKGKYAKLFKSTVESVKALANSELRTAAVETTTELLQGGLEKANKEILKGEGTILDKGNAVKALEEVRKFIFSEEGAETAASTAVGTFLLGRAGGATGAIATGIVNKARPKYSDEHIGELLGGVDELKATFNKLHLSGFWSKEQLDAGIKRLEEIVGVANSLDGNNKNRNESIRLILERTEKEEKLETLDESQRAPVKEQIAAINTKLEELAAPQTQQDGKDTKESQEGTVRNRTQEEDGSEEAQESSVEEAGTVQEGVESNEDVNGAETERGLDEINSSVSQAKTNRDAPSELEQPKKVAGNIPLNEQQDTPSKEAAVAKDNLSKAWDKWKDNQRNTGIAFDPKSKAAEDVALVKALAEYVRAVAAKTVAEVKTAIREFTSGEVELDDAGARDIITKAYEKQWNDKAKAAEFGYASPREAVNRVNARLGKKYARIEEIPDSELKRAQQSKTKEQKAIDKTVEGKMRLQPRVTMSEKVALKKQIKDFARGMREGAKDQRATAKEAAEILKGLKSNGKLTTVQAKALANAAAKVNFGSAKSVTAFVNMVVKTVEVADYDKKITDAKEALKKLKPKKDSFASDKARIKAFRKIDPTKVEDLDAYTEMAKQLYAAIKSPVRTTSKVTLQETVNYELMDEYIDKALKSQEKLGESELSEEYEYLEDLDLTVEEMNEIISLLEEGKELKLSDKRKDEIGKALGTVAAYYGPQLKEKAEDETATTREKRVMLALSEADISKLPFARKARTVRVMENILQNNSFSDATNTVNDIEIAQAIADIKKKGIKGLSPRILGNKPVAKAYVREVMTLTEGLKNVFRGQSTSDFVSEAGGVTDLDMGVVKARNSIKAIVKEYNTLVDKMVGYSTSENVATRRVYAFITRNDGKTPTQIQTEFRRRKAILEEQIKFHEKIDPDRAELLQKAVDNIGLLEAESLEDIKIDGQNKKIVDFFIEKFASLYDEHSEIAEMVYNKILPQDARFTPDIYELVEDALRDIDLNESVYFQDSMDTSESSMLKKTSKPKGLPKNEYGNVTRTLNLDFDNTMMRKLGDAILEINTAETVNKLDKFIKRDNLLEFSDRDAAETIKQKITSYVNTERGKSQPITEVEIQVNKGIDFVANLVAIKLLGSIYQPAKQTIPVALRAGLNMSPSANNVMVQAMSNPELRDFAGEYGTVGLRGKESSVDVENLNRKLNTSGIIEKMMREKLGVEFAHTYKKAKKGYEKAVEAPLKYTLENPDVWIAKAAWMGYYSDKMTKLGKKLDLKTPNKTAVQYANSMVAQTQNEAQVSKMGEVFKSKRTVNKIIRNILFPFANFQQALRSNIYNNVIIATSKTTTEEDRKTAALGVATAMVEIITFNVVSQSLRALNAMVLASMFGLIGDDEDDDREIDPLFLIPMNKEERRHFYTNLISDLAPAPILDNLAQGTVEWMNKQIKESNYENYDKFEDSFVYAPHSAAEVFINGGGKFGTGYDMLKQTNQLIDMSDIFNSDGKYTKSSMFGDTEYDIPLYRESDIDLALALQAFYLLGPAPKEIGTAATELLKDIEKEGGSSGEGGNMVKPKPQLKPRVQPKPRPSLIK